MGNSIPEKERMLCFLYKNVCSLLAPYTPRRGRKRCTETLPVGCVRLCVCVCERKFTFAFKEFHTHTHVRSGSTKSTHPDDDEISMKPNTTGGCAEHLALLCEV